MAKKNETVAEAADGAGKKTVEKAAEDKKNNQLKKLPKKSFNLSAYKKENGYDKVEYKPLEWLNVSPAFADATGIPGIPLGHITLIRGHSNTSKTTLMLEAAISAQQKGILPVFIISEMKWSFEHSKMMGLEFDENKEGFFIYVDRSTVKTIEDVAAFINKMLDDQEKGLIPHEICFFWDSIGSLPCAMSVEKQKNNNEWNAGAMSVQFASHINQRIIASRKAEAPYVNTMVAVNKVWTQKPLVHGAFPTMENKGGKSMFLDSSIVITFGNISSSGLNDISAVAGGKKVSFGNRVKVKVEKNHVNGVSTSGKVIITPHGYIPDDPKALAEYKKNHIDYLRGLLGTSEGNIETEISEEETDMGSDVLNPEEGI